MKRLVFLMAIAISFSLLISGCFLDSWFGDDDEAVTAATEYATINGSVAVPAAGASKVQYKAPPTDTKVYLLLASKTWTQRLAFTTNSVQSTTVDASGNYKFELAVKGTVYCIVIDIGPSFGTADGFVESVTAGSTASAAITNFVRDLNTSTTTIVAVTADKDTYAQGEAMIFTVTGRVPASDVHVEVYNEGTTNGDYLWASDVTAITAGDIPAVTTFTHTIPAGWANGTSYKVYVAIGTELLSSDTFTVDGIYVAASAPTGTGVVSIDAGAVYTADLTVDLTVTKPSTDVTQMRFSNSSDFSAAVWEPVAATKTAWALDSTTATAGTAWVYAQFADSSANLYATEVKDSIIYQTSPTVVLSYSADLAKAGAITITATYSEVVKDALTPKITITDSGAHVVQGADDMAVGGTRATWTYAYTVIADDGTHDDGTTTVTLLTVTNASDVDFLVPANNTFVIDTTAPTVSNTKIVVTGNNGNSADTFIVGDVMTVAWDNTTATGDANTDIVSVVVDFLDFGGAADVAATNSGDTWTATYTLVAGTNKVGQAVSVTATDTAGNETTTSDVDTYDADLTIPDVTAAISLDLDADGVVDAIEIEFTEAILDSTVTPGDLVVDETGEINGTDDACNGGQTTVAFIAADATDDDKYYRLTISNPSNITTTGSMDVKYTSGTLTDLEGNKLATMDAADSVLDKAAPVILAVHSTEIAVNNGVTDKLEIKFSEAIDDSTMVATDWKMDETGETIYIVGNGLNTQTDSVSGGIVNTADDQYCSITFLSNGAVRTTGVVDYVYTAGTTTDMATVALATTSGTATDKAIPSVTNAISIDLDADGKVDAIEFEFTEAILDSSVTPSDLVIDETGEIDGTDDACDGGQTTVDVITSDTSEDDRFYRLTISNPTNITSTGSMDAKYTSGTLTDLDGNKLATSGAETLSDKAAPVLLTVAMGDIDTAPVGNFGEAGDKLVLTMSEVTELISVDAAGLLDAFGSDDDGGKVINWSDDTVVVVGNVITVTEVGGDTDLGAGTFVNAVANSGADDGAAANELVDKAAPFPELPDIN